jgi:hypothetical protein
VTSSRPRVSARSRAFASSAFALSLIAPRVASACPACLGSDAQNATFLKIGSLFVFVPFLVVALVLYVLRQAPEARTDEKRAAR